MILSKPEYNRRPPVKAPAKRGTVACPAGHVTDFMSLAFGCHPSQAKDFHEQRRKHGHTGLSYDEKGNCHITSKRDYFECAKQAGYADLPECNIPPIKD